MTTTRFVVSIVGQCVCVCAVVCLQRRSKKMQRMNTQKCDGVGVGWRGGGHTTVGTSSARGHRTSWRGHLFLAGGGGGRNNTNNNKKTKVTH